MTTGLNDPHNLGKKELQACYQYFKTAQGAFDNLASQTDAQKPQEYEDLRDLCRMLKWQFRASRDKRIKTVLAQALAKSRATVAEGGLYSSRIKLGLPIGTGTPLGANIVPSIELSSKLETTQTRILKDTSSTSAGVAARLSLTHTISAEAGVNAEWITTRKYSNIDSYTDARALSKWTWWNGSKRDMLTQSRTLFSSCNHYKRNTRLAAQSLPYLETKLAERGLASPRFEPHIPTTQPIQIEYGQREALAASSRFDVLGLVTASADAKGDLLRTTKTQALDIIGLYDWSPIRAKEQLGSPREYDPALTPGKLIENLREHINDSSLQLTRAQLNRENAQALHQIGEKLDSRSRQLTREYIYFKTLGTIADGSDEDKIIRQLLEAHAILLRPEILKSYTIKAHTKTQTITVESKLKLAPGLSAQAGVKVSRSSVIDDDPHLSGTYLDITLNAQFDTRENLQYLISNGLSKAGITDFDPAPIIGQIIGTIFYQSHGVSARFSLKIKEGKPVLLLSQLFFTQKDAFNQTLPTLSPVAVEVTLGSEVETLREEQLGSQSLDMILPIALSKLAKGGDTSWWDRYVEKHAQAFDALLNNIAETDKATLISRELAAIKEKITSGKEVVDQLISAAQAARDRPDTTTMRTAREALKTVLTAYIDDYYDANVKAAWRVTS
ncbi:hypothetical protein HX776_16075 [Pseudomonas agarici]|nr:hypothetical protein [Pseudomonas agarici]NWC10328.1 hypothetical protein [Pseudomonas agarici]